MSNAFNTVELNTEITENSITIEQPLTELTELSLALVGGGSGAVAF
jgi:hypothetical protein